MATIYANDVAAYKGNSVSVTINAENLNNVGSLDIEIYYDSSAVTLNEIKNGSLVSGCLVSTNKDVVGVATFYSQFRLTPIGKYLIMSCQGTACHVNGSERVLNAITNYLGIKSGETTDDGLFTVEEVACLGCCSLAPVIMINGEAYGNLTPDSAVEVLKSIRAKEGK